MSPPRAAIRSAIPQENGLAVVWADGGREVLPWLWLRENCLCAECYDPRARQRNVFTAGLAADLSAQSVTVADGGALLRVLWADSAPRDGAPGDGAHESVWPAAALLPAGGDPRPPAELWDAAALAVDPPRIAFDRAMADDDGLRALLDLTARRGFAHVTGAPTDAAATGALARRIGYVRETLFGGLSEFEANAAMADSAFSDAELRPHTDATYSEDAPGVQILHCLAREAEGGESVMVDGLYLAERLRAARPEAFATLARVPITGRYIGDGAWLEATRPALRLDAAGRVVQLSFNNYDRAPTRIPAEEAAAFYDALAVFDRLANDPALQWRHVLAPGEMLVFDNWRILHGRSAFRGYRRMSGCYLNREDWLSRMRVLAAG